MLTTEQIMEVARAALASDESLREEGRREVYREIAALDPEVLNDLNEWCLFCGHVYAWNSEPRHEPTCLWLRAHAATQEPTQ